MFNDMCNIIFKMALAHEPAARKDEILEFYICRVLLIICVVFEHAVTQYLPNLQYGGLFYDEALWKMNLGDSPLHLCFVKVVLFTQNFTMASFFAISGVLFFYGIEKRRYESFVKFVRSRTTRFLIPFFVINLFYNIPIKFATGYFDRCPNLWNAIVRGQILLEGNNYLWFLWAMFLVQIMCWLLERCITLHYSVKLILVILLHLSRFTLGNSLSYTAMENLLWFYLGFLFAAKREECYCWIVTHKFYTPLSLFLLITLQLVKSKYPSLGLVIYLMQHLSGMYFVYSFSVLFVKFARCNIVRLIADNGLAIYIYSDPLNYAILNIVVLVFGVRCFCNNLYAAFILIFRFFVTLLIPLLIAKVLRHFKVKYIV